MQDIVVVKPGSEEDIVEVNIHKNYFSKKIYLANSDVENRCIESTITKELKDLREKKLERNA
jgi:hypothetical protein